MPAMTPRERVRTALSHQEPDRVPVCIGGTGNKLTESRMSLLRAHFGIEGDVSEVLVGPQLMRLDNRVLDALGTDVRYLHMRPPTGFRTREAPGGGWYYDWGLIYREHPESGMYEYTNQPLAEATIEGLDGFEWPDPRDPARWAGLAEEARQLYEQTDCALVAYRPKYNGLFELCQVLRGTEKLLMDMVLNPPFVEALFWKVGEVLKGFYANMSEARPWNSFHSREQMDKWHADPKNAAMSPWVKEIFDTIDQCRAIDAEGIRALKPERIVISPGPCTPNEAGCSVEVLQKLSDQFPILGVCLGHQSLGQAFGGKVVRAGRLMHGKTSSILHDGRGVFAGVPSPFTAVRYHSLLVERESLPDCLEISAETDIGEIMGLRHQSLPVEGVQFHPESIATDHGMQLLRNFLEL